MRRTGMIMSCFFTIFGALIALFVWNGGAGAESSRAQASKGSSAFRIYAPPTSAPSDAPIRLSIGIGHNLHDGEISFEGLIEVIADRGAFEDLVSADRHLAAFLVFQVRLPDDDEA